MSTLHMFEILDIKNKEDLLRFKSWQLHLVALWLWAYFLTYWCLSFLPI